MPIAIKTVAPTSLEPAPWNPPGRTDPDDYAMKALVDSISRRGICYPPIVTPENMIIEGHRRVAAAVILNIKLIEVRVEEGPIDEIYAELNATSKKMSSHDLLGIWLKKPTAVTPGAGAKYVGMVDRLGRKLVVDMHKAGLGPRAYQTAVSMSRYCGDESGKLLPEIIRWMMAHGQVGQVAKIMAAGGDAKVLLKAVKDMRPLRLTAILG